jgi:hypothetical protein
MLRSFRRQAVGAFAVAPLALTTLAGPASAATTPQPTDVGIQAETRYRAVRTCSVNGRSFSADLRTYGKPTRTGDLTTVWTWGYKIEPAGGNPNNSEVWAWKTINKYDDVNGWLFSGSVGKTMSADENGAWHNGPMPAYPFIGFPNSNQENAIRIAVVFDGDTSRQCFVTLRVSDLYWSP